MIELSDQVWDILACPCCGTHLTRTDAGALCANCQHEFGRSRAGQIDLRLNKERDYSINFTLPGDSLDLDPSDVLVRQLEMNRRSEVDFSGVTIPRHLCPELLSQFPKAKSDNALMLDVGCGNALHKEVCERAGFSHVGIDYADPDAPMLGDAHALPFRSNCFEFLIAIAALEHMRYPFVMMNEAYRVLHPGGVLIGSVAFSEPFHGNSFYHHTHLGTLNSLRSAGFCVTRLAPEVKWTVLYSHHKSLLPLLPSSLYRAVVMPLQLLHRMWWKLFGLIKRSPEEKELLRVLNTAGCFYFIAVKPDN